MSEENPNPTNLWFHTPLQVLGVLLCVYLYFRPNSDYLLLGFGVFVALMMLADMRPWQKAIYIVVIVAMGLVGKTASDREHSKADADAQAAANVAESRYETSLCQFNKIVAGVQATIDSTNAEITTNNKQFRATIAANKATQDQEQKGFEALLQKESDLFNQQEQEFSAERKEIDFTREEIEATVDVGIRALGVQGHLDSEAISRQQQANAAQASSPPSSSPPFSPALTPAQTQDLKRRGLEMAKEIDDWIASVSQDVPKPTAASPAGWTPAVQDADRKASEQFGDRLNSEWNARFKDAQTLVYQLHAGQGLLLACAGGGFSRDPSSILSLRKLCADRIEYGALHLN
ncbi:MAG: hypothetical protein WBF06_00310 [Candidatus Acidiferrales bacterium]